MVRIENLSNNPDKVLTNDKNKISQNIANNDLSIILVYSNNCRACRMFHPIYKKCVESLKSGGNFYEISGDSGNQQTMDAIEVLTAHAPKDKQGYIPMLLAFCKSKCVNCSVGVLQENDFFAFVKECQNKCK